VTRRPFEDGYIGARFIARFESECAECIVLLMPGDEVGYVDNEVVCFDCYEDAKRK